LTSIVGNDTTTTPTDLTSAFALNPGETIVDIYANTDTVWALTSEHRVLAWGYNGSGQAGVGDPNFSGDSNVCTPTDITPNFNLGADEYITRIDTTTSYAYISTYLTNKGNLYGVGDSGSIGLWYSNIYTPMLIVGDVENAAIGSYQALIVTDGGTKLLTEANNFGNGNGMGFTDPMNDQWYDMTSYLGLGADETIAQVFVGYETAAVLTSEGRVLMWGRGDYFGLGFGVAENIGTPADLTDRIVGTGTTISSVYFGANAATDVQVVNDHLLRVVAPAGDALGAVDVTVYGYGDELLTARAAGYEYVGGGGNNENVVCDDNSGSGSGNTGNNSDNDNGDSTGDGIGDSVGAPNTGGWLGAVASVANAAPLRLGLLIVMALSSSLAGAVAMRTWMIRRAADCR
jgi:hypothetical protein